MVDDQNHQSSHQGYYLSIDLACPQLRATAEDIETKPNAHQYHPCTTVTLVGVAGSRLSSILIKIAMVDDQNHQSSHQGYYLSIDLACPQLRATAEDIETKPNAHQYHPCTTVTLVGVAGSRLSSVLIKIAMVDKLTPIQSPRILPID